jgi:hypothetical protein
MTRQRKTPDLLFDTLAGSETEEGFKEKLRGCSQAKARTNTVADHMVNHEPLLFKEAELLRAVRPGSCSATSIRRANIALLAAGPAKNI